MLGFLLIVQLLLHHPLACHAAPDDCCPSVNRLNSYGTQLMVELYNILNREEDEEEMPSVRMKRHLQEEAKYLSPDEIAKGQISDVIYSMHPIDGESDRNVTMLKMEFSMPKINAKAKVLTAELKLFQARQVGTFADDVYMITAYKRLRVGRRDFFYRIGEVITAINFSGWITIDISRVFKEWLKDRTQNHELHVAANPYNSGSGEVDPRALGIMFQHGHPENGPFILAFLKTKSLGPHLRHRRHIDTQLNFNAVEPKGNKCSLMPFTVEFKQLNMDKMVLAPQEYVTGICSGFCDFPIKFPMGVSQHAIVQSLMHLKYPEHYPSPKCAPKETKSMAALLQYGANTFYKVYPHMIVTSCACL